MNKVFVLGGNGFLGSDLVDHLKKYDLEVHSITRENYEEYKGQASDIFINANGNSKRFWANEHPFEDFKVSTVSTYQSIRDFSCNLYIYISTIDVYPDHSSQHTTLEDQNIVPEKLSAYGLHKYLSEEIVRSQVKNFLILRSCAILASHLTKGFIYDLLHNKPLFITPNSRLQFITAKAIAEIIEILTNNGTRNEVFNVGGRGSCLVEDIIRWSRLGGKIQIKADQQVYEANVSKLTKKYPLKTSEEYIKDFIKNYHETV